ncbi:MAG: hypothetical protein ACP5KG_11830 [Myxococcota bacterium]
MRLRFFLLMICILPSILYADDKGKRLEKERAPVFDIKAENGVENIKTTSGIKSGRGAVRY